jgi:hypothetical protein
MDQDLEAPKAYGSGSATLPATVKSWSLVRMLFKFVTGDRYLERCVAAPLPELCLLGEPGEPEKELLTEDAHACAVLIIVSRRSHLTFPAQAHARFHFLKTMITIDRDKIFLQGKTKKLNHSHYMKSYTIYIVIA